MTEETRRGRKIWKMSHGLVGRWRPVLLYGQRNIVCFCATQTCWLGWSCLFGSGPLMYQVFFFLLVFNLPGQSVFSSNTAPNEQLFYLPDVVPVVHSTFKQSKQRSQIFQHALPNQTESPELSWWKRGYRSLAFAVLFWLLEYPGNFEELRFQLGLVARHDWKALKELRRTELICGVFWKATSDCCRNFLIQNNAPSQAPDIKGFV